MRVCSSMCTSGYRSEIMRSRRVPFDAERLAECDFDRAAS